MDQLRVLSLEEKSDLGPLRILSFDLEAAGRRGVFPDPMVDPVIQISIQFEPRKRPVLLSFKECSPIPDADVFSFEKEESLLLAFRDCVLGFDPDFLTGYNICNFDMEYLQKRSVALGIEKQFAMMTRVEHVGLKVKELYFQSAQVFSYSSSPQFCSLTWRMGRWENESAIVSPALDAGSWMSTYGCLTTSSWTSTSWMLYARCF